MKLDELLQLSSNLEEAVEIPVEICPLSEMPPCMRYKIITKDEKLPIKMQGYSTKSGSQQHSQNAKTGKC
jgi:hypothetical protein